MSLSEFSVYQALTQAISSMISGKYDPAINSVTAEHRLLSYIIAYYVEPESEIHRVYKCYCLSISAM